MNKYKNLNQEQIDELLSNYLIDSWSYSKVSSFSRNEKAFEMQYIYRCYGKSSSSTVAGQAYHAALNLFFQNLKEDSIVTDIVTLEAVAFRYIDDYRADYWKLQKTTPTVEECKASAVKTASQLLRNFLSEVAIYTDEIAEVIDSELSINSWLTINGVDIPIPCKMELDLPVRTNDGKLVIIDHKSRRSFTDDRDLFFESGKQAIIYTLGYEEKYSENVDEVWIVENKYSKNKDNSPQLRKYKIIMDADTRRLYEAQLYEPLRRMIEAVSDPDYVYIINDKDSFTDKAEIYDFWARTMIAEVDDFNIPENKKPILKKRLKKIRDASLVAVTPTVIKNFKTYTEQFIPYDLSNKNMSDQEKIEHILRSFGIIVKVQHTFEGYSSSSYLVEISAGVSISSIYKYRLDIANALDVSNVRIHKDLFVYEGKAYLVIESGKKNTATLYWDKSKLDGHNIPLGVDNFQQTITWNMDNQSAPHMLVCGATGSGKSVFLRSTIEYALLAGINEIYIFDPKHEYSKYSSIQGVIVVSNIEEIELQLMMLVEEMERRVKNHIAKKTLIVFDEFADAVANSRKGNELKNYGMVADGFLKNGSPKMKRVVISIDKSLEENLRILLQKGRSCGFRIISATQRASTKIITGDAKVNFPIQVCFRVPKDVDSMVVIDEPGAEALNGRGDGLIKSPEYPGVIRFQAFYKE